MATSFSDMMNDPNALYAFPGDGKSASFDMHQDQMMTSSVAPDNNNVNNMMFPPSGIHHHHMPDPAAANSKHNHAAAAVMNAMVADTSQLLQSNNAASFHLVDAAVTPAPIVKSQAAAVSSGAPGYFNSATGPFAQQQPVDSLMYPPAASYSHQAATYPPPQPPPAAGFIAGSSAFHPEMMMATHMFPQPSFVSAAAAAPISPPYTYDQQNLVIPQPPLAVSEPQSQRPNDAFVPSQAPPQQPAARSTAATATRRQPMPRRHTVSTPYQPPNKGKEPEPEMPQNKLRKVLKAKRHRSLGKLNMAAATSSPVEKWMSPDTSSSSSICSPILSTASTANEFDQMLLLEKLQQQQHHHHQYHQPPNGLPPAAAAAPTDLVDEDEHLQCLWSGCYLDMKTLDELITHVKEMHIGSGKALYYCGWKDCPRNQKPFTKRHKMHNHLRTHTGERPFECTEPGCGKRFSRPDSLTTHAKIHSNVRPYLCPYENCGKAYYHLRSLRKHERTHEEQQQDNGCDAAAVDGNTTHAVAQSGDTQHLDWMF